LMWWSRTQSTDLTTKYVTSSFQGTLTCSNYQNCSLFSLWFSANSKTKRTRWWKQFENRVAKTTLASASVFHGRTLWLTVKTHSASETRCRCSSQFSSSASLRLAIKQNR
jgi:hypothetical protein